MRNARLMRVLMLFPLASSLILEGCGVYGVNPVLKYPEKRSFLNPHTYVQPINLDKDQPYKDWYEKAKALEEIGPAEEKAEGKTPAEKKVAKEKAVAERAALKHAAAERAALKRYWEEKADVKAKKAAMATKAAKDLKEAASEARAPAASKTAADVAEAAKVAAKAADDEQEAAATLRDAMAARDTAIAKAALAAQRLDDAKQAADKAKAEGDARQTAAAARIKEAEWKADEAAKTAAVQESEALEAKAFLDALHAEETRAADDAKTARNLLQAGIMRRSDALCEQHKSYAFETQSDVAFILALATSGMSGAAAVVTQALTKSALAAGAAFTSAGAAEFSDKVYHQLFIGTVLRSIDLSRQDLAHGIARKRDDSVITYNADDAIRDAQSYHQLCSFYSGLVTLSDKIENAAQTYDQILARIGKLDTEIAKIQKAIDGLGKDRTNNKDPEYNQLLATKVDLIRQRETVYQQLSSARTGSTTSPAPVTAPKTPNPPETPASQQEPAPSKPKPSPPSK